MPHHHHHHHAFHHSLHSPRGPLNDGLSGFGRHGHRDPMGHGPHHDPEHRARKRERMFESGGLRLIALHLIAQQPSHGYDIIRAVGELVGGDYQPSPGTIYPTLSYLVDMGHATATETQGGRKQYTITPEGQQALDEQAPAVQRLLARLAEGKGRGERRRPPQLVRALENFKTALRLKLDGQPGAAGAALSEAQVQALAAILDEAALKIERA